MSLIDARLLAAQETRKVRPPKTLYVTDLTKPCLKQAYLDIVEEKDFPVETLRIFKAGNILEDYWLSLLEQHPDYIVLGKQLPIRYKLQNDWMIHGRIDALILHKTTSNIYIHEVKSASRTDFLQEPKEEHLKQLQFYLCTAQLENGQLDYLDKTSILRGDKPVDKSFPVFRDDDFHHDMVDSASLLIMALEKAELPAANRGAWDGKICNYCLHRETCEKT